MESVSMVAAFAPASSGFGGAVSHALVAAASGANIVLASRVGFAPRDTAKRGAYVVAHPKKHNGNGWCSCETGRAVGTERLDMEAL